jgi:hypothetical protein
MIRWILALPLLLALGACAEVWTRPGTSEAVADATEDMCSDEARLAVPPQMAWQVVRPGGYVSERRCWREGGREVCRSFNRWRPPEYGWVDVNAPPREAFRRACMREKGFRFEGYRPLRLE